MAEPRAALRRIAWLVAPGRMANRAVRYERLWRDRLGSTDTARKFVAQYGTTVLHGPFRGLRYPPDGDAAVAKYLGVYEPAISEWIAEGIATSPPKLINLGAADGYYAVGFKMASPPTEVIAYELSSDARDACAHTADNNSQHIELRGRATERSLLGIPADGALVLSDIEGNEVDLFSERVAEHLRSATVIIEIHEGNRPDATETILGRFRDTHMAELREIRVAETPSELEAWSKGEIQTALSENRGIEIRWARLTPRHRKERRED